MEPTTSFDPQAGLSPMNAPLRAALRPFPVRFVVALSVLALAACDTASVMTEDLFSGNIFSGTPKECPRIAIPPHTERMTTFKIGIGRDLIDVTFNADFVGGALECQRPNESNEVTAIVVIEVAAQRGPAVPQGDPLEIALPVFIAKTDRTGDIRDKAVFKTLLRFPEGQPRTRTREAFDVNFSLGPGETPADLGILVGFQLNKEQLEYNRLTAR
jgi:hypothetical protein